MKNDLHLVPRFKIAVQGFTLGACLLIGGWAVAQPNLLGNPSFESPLGVGTTNWTIKYAHGGPDDWTIKDRTTSASRYRSQILNDRGLHFRPSNNRVMHAYASQTLSGLQVGRTYTITGSMGCESRDFGNGPITYRLWFEAIGADGTGGVVSSPDAPNTPGDANQPPSWGSFTIYQKPDADGKIEIRLHCDKNRGCNYDKLILINGYFDDFAVR